MSTAELKTELQQLISSIDDSKMLNAIYTLLYKQTKHQIKAENLISDEEKRLIKKGILQLKSGQGIPHLEVRKKVSKMLAHTK